MNRASRIKLAKQLLHYAKMVLDAEQFKEAKEIEARNILAMSEYHTKLKNL